MIRAGIFDLGGVLVPETTSYICDDIKQTLGIDDITFEKAWITLLPQVRKGEITEEEFWNQFVSLTHATKPMPQESFFLREFKKRFVLNKPVMSIIKILKKKEYKLAALSDTITTHIEFLKKQGVFTPFDVSVFSNEVQMIKPDPKIFQITLDKLGVSASEAFFVDDRQVNIAAANALGIHGIVFVNADQLRKDLRSLGVSIR